MAGFLVVLEGIDGSGKTTLAGRLAEVLAADGTEVILTAEPTHGPLGQQIRAMARGGRAGVSPSEELALFHEDRRQHVAEVVRPALARGATVIQDRSYFSTVAYQGERGIDRSQILAESQVIAPTPDLLLVVDLPVEIALARIAEARQGGADDFEKASSLARVREVFRAFEAAVILDGTLGREALADHALDAIRIAKTSRH